MVDLNQIRARLSDARSEAEKLAERRRRPPLQQGAGDEGRSGELELELEHERRRREELEARRKVLEAALEQADARRADSERRAAALQNELSADHARMEEMLDESRVEIERTRSQLEGRLADAQKERDQARAERDRAQGGLEAKTTELRASHARLEAELARGEVQGEDSGGTKRAQRRRRRAQAEKRIAELERELRAEREQREDLGVIVELLEEQQADDRRRLQDAERAALERLITPNGKDAPDHAPPQVPAEQLPGAKPASANPEPQPDRSREDGADGWGVPLEAFPIKEPGEQSGGVGKGSAGEGGAARQVRSRRRSRRGGR